jgi:hypothetical protein
MTTLARAAAIVTLVLAATPGALHAADLAGSRRSMTRQHDIAVEQDYDFSRSEAQVQALVDEGALVRVTGNADFRVDAQVAHPYARAEVQLFLQRLGAQYREATGERLVVTSLTRPLAEQPRNASALSVHPAGMAVDLRVPAKAATRAWLERALLGMERQGLLDVTRERRPPHYHVAIYPVAYRAYVTEREGAERAAAARAPVTVPAAPVVPVALAAAPVADTPAPARADGVLLLLAITTGLTGAAAARVRVMRMKVQG